MGRRWTDEERALLRELYPHHTAAAVAKALGRSLSGVYGEAFTLGLCKSEAFKAAQKAAEARRLIDTGAAHRYPKGHVPANKGLRRPGWAAGRMRDTQFRKGGWPANKDPAFYVLGALRVNADGYIDMRVSFDKGALGWRALHLILWEDAHGPIPRGHCLRFKDGEKLNVCLENLELIHRGENMRRNTIHNLPKPVAQTLQLLGALKRVINNRRKRANETHDR